MSKKYSFISLALVWSTVLTGSAFAISNEWNNDAAFGLVNGSPVVTNWATAARWSQGVVPAALQGDINITNVFNVVTTITNASGTGLNFLRVISGNAVIGTANSNVTVITSGNLSADFGFNIGSNSTLIVANTATFGNNAGSSFNLGKTASQGQGTLIISNGASTFLYFNAALRNDGTIIFTTSASTQNSQINYGQNNGNALGFGTFTNAATGTILKLGNTGTGSLIGEFAGTNNAFANLGTITVTGGAMRIDPRNAFNNGGFRNAGLLQIDSNAVAEIRRTTNAWTGTGANMPTNSGTIFLNGGELRTFDSDGFTPGTNTARIVVNSGTGLIRGNGLLDLNMRNETGGIIEARDGTLTCVASANNNGTWVSTNFGGAVSVLNFAVNGFDLGGGALLNSNGTIRLISGANTTIATSYRQNFGTIDFAGAGNLLIANSASADSLTNEWVIKKTAAGDAFITTGYGGVAGNFNYGLFNRGTIDVSSGGRLTINTSNSFSQPFNNMAGGTVAIGVASTVRVSRTSAAWGSTTSPTNSGTIALNGGVLETADDAGLNTARFLRNAGRIIGTGTINASVSNLTGSIISPGFSIGTNTINGTMAFTSNATLVAEVGDLLNVAGSLVLDANSALTIAGGTAGNVYTVATCSARSGTFGTNTVGYTVAYSPTTVAVQIQTLTITATTGLNGNISPTGAVSVVYNNDQTFTITPNSCYQVSNVITDGVSVGAATSVTFFGVIAPHTLSASFTPLVYTINASAGNGGNISPTGAVGVNCGTDQLFTISPITGYHILDVLVDGNSAGPIASTNFVNVTTGHTIAASFAINTYTITATAGANGSIAPSGAVTVNHTNDQSFTITPAACNHILDVVVDGNSVGPIGSTNFLSVTGNHTIAATFTNNTYTITATAGVNGTINPIGAVIIDCSSNQTFTITGNPGYPVLDVLVDGGSVGPTNSYTFNNVTTGHTIDASFATELFRILSITRQGSDVQVVWPSVGGHSYIVQTNSNLTGTFTDLSTLAIPGIGESTTNYLDIGAAAATPAQFYRIKLVP